jgi:DNA-binding transcriptional regulator of glucitol operon
MSLLLLILIILLVVALAGGGWGYSRYGAAGLSQRPSF